METVHVASKINQKIVALDGLKDSLEGLAHEKAMSACIYEESLSKAILRLKEEHPTSILEKIARGECSSQKFNMDVAEGRYKNALKIIDLTEAQLNGYQSINRHLSEV